MKQPDDAPPTLPSPIRRNWIWWTFQQVLTVLIRVWLGYRARYVERLPKEGGGLVLANHQSFLDPLLIGLPLKRPISYVARDSLFRVPVIGWILRKTYVMPINRDSASTAAIREAVRRMQHGFLVGVFPEGTRTADGSVGDFKPGFIAFLRRTNLPVFPVGIAGAFESYSRKARFPKPGRVRVVFGEPITPEELAAYRGKGHEDDLVALIRSRIVACQQEAQEWRDASSPQSRVS